MLGQEFVADVPRLRTRFGWATDRRVRKLVIAVLILAALVYSRWLLFPDYLITFDEINFAFAIKEFNPASHQPQPPGYPLFVGLLKILAWIIPKVEIVFFCAAIVISAAALALVSKLGDLIASERTGMIAALLLLFNPPFWLSALSNPVRLTSAMGASAVALCAWLAIRDRSARWICAAAVTAGFAAGFRPMLAVHSLPLIVWAAFVISIGPKLAACAVASYAAAVSLWFFPLIASVGGISRFFTLLATYSRDQIAPTSALFGASIGASVTMASQAMVWSCLGVLSWVWAIVFVRPNCVMGSRLAAQFLAVWFVPGLLGHSIFHVADPDHTLDIIPVTCLAGALLLKRAVQSMSARQRTVVIGVAVLLNVLLFLKPVSKAAQLSTYAPVRSMDDYISTVIDGIAYLRANGPVTAIFYAPITGWRHLWFYDRGVHIMVITPNDDESGTVWHIRGNRSEAHKFLRNIIPVPACGIVAWIDPAARPVAAAPLRSIQSLIYFTHESDRTKFYFRQFQFVPSDEGCQRVP